jgi:hypothetical protein
MGEPDPRRGGALTDDQDGIRVKTRAAMRKNPSPDPAPAHRPDDRPANADAAPAGQPEPAAEPIQAAGEPVPPTDDNTAPSLVWPPVEDELQDWEVLNVQSTGQTFIEPMKFTPPPTPPPYVPPAPVDDPVGDTSLLPVSNDVNLPETELIEPLSVQPTVQMPSPSLSGARAAASHKPPAAPDDRTVMIPRPAGLTPKAQPPGSMSPAAPAPAQASHDETNPGSTATRILVAPNFAASLGHAPTVPVSALHRAARPQPAFGPRPMEDTLPAGFTSDLLSGEHREDASDDTAVPASAHGDTHPVPSPVARRAPGGSPGPFSRVPSRGPQPVVVADRAPESSPPPVSIAPPPLAFGPRVPASGPGPSPMPAGATPIAPSPSLPVAAPARELSIPARPAPASNRTKVLSILGAIAAVLLLALGVYQVLSMRSTSAAAPVPATLSVESTPAGATVTIDGAARGKTPVRLELSEGRHALDVSLAGATRHVPLTLAGGTVTAHSFEFAAPAAATATDAAIEIRSEPAGGRVLVDGVARGVTPIVVTGLTAGVHQVQVGGPFRTVTKTMKLAAKQQALLVVTPARTATTPAPGADRDRTARGSSETGFISIQSPIVLRVVRNGDFVGTSEDTRLSLPIGNQVIGLENESVGFRDVRTVEVLGGKVTAVPVTLPKGEISINARPWAEVFVDGSRIGETPVSQLSLPVGIHDILFRHPDFPERRVSVVVKIGATGRAFTDFTK